MAKVLKGKARLKALEEGRRAWEALQRRRKRKAKKAKAAGKRLQAWWKRQPKAKRSQAAKKGAATRAARKGFGAQVQEYRFGKRKHRSISEDWHGPGTYDSILATLKAQGYTDVKGYSWIHKVEITQLDDKDNLYGPPEVRFISERFVEPAMLERVTYEARTHLQAMTSGEMFGYKATEVISVSLIIYYGRVKD